ncbi:lysostaphin resistance A-like protein [Plantactinospora siamensis]|uniref:Lysostaphin resistance A-like protein n=1 Tax=Plantactinospora siamensis TaxID=555372 RepID=A0ABV6NRG8_9ACTN
MTSVDVRPAGTARPERFGWGRTIALHLGPAAVTFGTALALAPLMTRLGLPASFALTTAFALVLSPIELGLLLHAAHRATGRWSLRALPAVIAYRCPLRRWWLLVPVLLAVAVGLAIAWSPLGAALGGGLTGLWPDWTLPGYDPTVGHPRSLLVGVLLVSLVVDGLLNPAIEELYFRGHLLPRLPVAGWTAVPVSAALFAVQHYWQPYNWVLIFILQLISTALVVRSRSVRLGIALHCLANSLGIVLTLAAVLTAPG